MAAACARSAARAGRSTGVGSATGGRQLDLPLDVGLAQERVLVERGYRPPLGASRVQHLAVEPLRLPRGGRPQRQVGELGLAQADRDEVGLDGRPRSADIDRRGQGHRTRRRPRGRRGPGRRGLGLGLIEERQPRVDPLLPAGSHALLHLVAPGLLALAQARDVAGRIDPRLPRAGGVIRRGSVASAPSTRGATLASQTGQRLPPGTSSPPQVGQVIGALLPRPRPGGRRAAPSAHPSARRERRPRARTPAPRGRRERDAATRPPPGAPARFRLPLPSCRYRSLRAAAIIPDAHAPVQASSASGASRRAGSRP